MTFSISSPPILQSISKAKQQAATTHPLPSYSQSQSDYVHFSGKNGNSTVNLASMPSVVINSITGALCTPGSQGQSWQNINSLMKAWRPLWSQRNQIRNYSLLNRLSRESVMLWDSMEKKPVQLFAFLPPARQAQYREELIATNDWEQLAELVPNPVAFQHPEDRARIFNIAVDLLSSDDSDLNLDGFYLLAALVSNPATTKNERDCILNSDYISEDEEYPVSIVAYMAKNTNLSENERLQYLDNEHFDGSENEDSKFDIWGTFALSPALSRYERDNIFELCQLFAHEDPLTFNYFFGNTNKTDQEAHNRAGVLGKLASNPTLTFEERDTLLNHALRISTATLAQNLKGATDVECYKSLILEGLASNPQSTKDERAQIFDTIERFSENNKAAVLRGLASNPHLTEDERTQIFDTIERFSENNKASVLRGLAFNPYLTKDERTQIFGSITNFSENNKARVLGKFASNPALTVDERAQIFDNITTKFPNTMKNIASVLTGLASNPKLTTDEWKLIYEFSQVLTDGELRAQILEALGKHLAVK